MQARIEITQHPLLKSSQQPRQAAVRLLETMGQPRHHVRREWPLNHTTGKSFFSAPEKHIIRVNTTTNWSGHGCLASAATGRTRARSPPQLPLNHQSTQAHKHTSARFRRSGRARQRANTPGTTKHNRCPTQHLQDDNMEPRYEKLPETLEETPALPPS